jgi:hypothetical protein
MKYAKSKFATGPDMLVNCPKVLDIDPHNFCQSWIMLHDEWVEKQLWQFIAFKCKQKYWGQATYVECMVQTKTWVPTNKAIHGRSRSGSNI